MTYRFTTIIHREGRWYVAHCAELGVVSQGKNIEEAKKNLKEAIKLYLEDEPRAKRYSLKSAPLVTTIELEYA
ncbi:MAG: HicB family protein [Parcubacteria group bacterium CG11_big_fil_rev_8_21_14_0_20_39_14]|nr:MAG: HicB family protein [Parcubacteria group bacterium CG11_big_fil_rev_8_21_14_0_20_39_14]PIS35475.1 MAG: HicB family protein [Parcubacteria group bacterium CG08_land_8_20_14_0_20_38_56]